MANFTANRFREFSEKIKELAQQHSQFQDEPLHLAIVYDPGRDPDDIFLFEVLGNFGSNLVDPDREMLETTFGSSTEFQMKANQRLHLILTNPKEFKEALTTDWLAAQELRKAVKDNQYEVIFNDEVGSQLLGELQT